ncbi:hypothetical protein OUZ56_012009 [Daphnia magna]|uniref:Uncharacterized protein n=1 Tax=Daphnia magna TaxID=35525 RepID=A0ABQ9Z1T1_9CRUS|nr:hypothetical protein OUZ56_012009 [Daphnia magna]
MEEEYIRRGRREGSWVDSSKKGSGDGYRMLTGRLNGDEEESMQIYVQFSVQVSTIHRLVTWWRSKDSGRGKPKGQERDDPAVAASGLTEAFESFDTEIASVDEEKGAENKAEKDAMAVSRLLKFKGPLMFSGKQGEDMENWLDSCESVGDYNRWNNEEKRSNFGMTATAMVPACYGIKHVGTHGGRKRATRSSGRGWICTVWGEKKNRSQNPRINKPPQENFYKVMNLCRQVGPTMTQAMKLDYFFRGLKPNLLEKLWILKPQTCSEFLSAIKLHSEATELAYKRGWAVAMMVAETTRKEVSWGNHMEENGNEERRPGSPDTASRRMKKVEGKSDTMGDLLAENKQQQTEMAALKKISGTGGIKTQEILISHKDRETRDRQTVEQFVISVGKWAILEYSAGRRRKRKRAEKPGWS